MLKTWVAMVASCLVGCFEEPPSCQQAVTHYYDAGCKLVDLSTGVDIPSSTVLSECKALLATAPNSTCESALEDLRSCWGGVTSPAHNNADCDCSPEQDALLTCD